MSSLLPPHNLKKNDIRAKISIWIGCMNLGLGTWLAR